MKLIFSNLSIGYFSYQIDMRTYQIWEKTMVLLNQYGIFQLICSYIKLVCFH